MNNKNIFSAKVSVSFKYAENEMRKDRIALTHLDLQMLPSYRSSTVSLDGSGPVSGTD